ncbi:hypothetical protein KSD_46580 [Ktedonobacter sp. SOSP1-85]|uniref:phosphodiester glycosidase family protein n=1 Tax=Ktedonobacter sp. SOSP1-85 TaxID=2778367 RepID=UPI001915EC70|nr:phosphodiester glycosidase family protein [Ktedonobacter sp. SOSP1-85]GHO76887.1 hypothetical protein KSD_46580 [Ktedonobacter sp. SOSP1-85]
MLIHKHVAAQLFLCAALLMLLAGQSALTYAKVAHPWRSDTPPNWPLVLNEKQTLDQALARGLQISTETLSTADGSQHASLLNVDLSDPYLRLGVVQANDQLLSRGETVGSMANRSQAIAGINGDFFEINTTSAPINMVMIDGELWQSPTPPSRNANDFAVFGINSDGNMVIDHEQFGGTVSTGSVSHPLNAVNRYAIPRDGGMLLVTSRLGAMSVSGYTVALLKPVDGSRYIVTSLQTNMTTLNKLTGDQQALVGGGESGRWLQANIHQGETLDITQQLMPDSDLRYALGGGPQLVKDGQIPNASELGDSAAVNPLTAVGISRDGRHAFFVVFDGREAGADHSHGLTRSQMAGYLLEHGAYQALLFDGGGSAEMVARLPGQDRVSVINTPSDGHERLVANSLLIYKTEQQASQPSTRRYR